ncbi:unnamed protein product [Durusdinium trenchii]|uniref:Uncharacterized protein n=1 Tax=Durusdinium trenchii TaxID=1381693 RepID=A0ABP0QRT5_9DINO
MGLQWIGQMRERMQDLMSESLSEDMPKRMPDFQMYCCAAFGRKHKRCFDTFFRNLILSPCVLHVGACWFFSRSAGVLHVGLTWLRRRTRPRMGRQFCTRIASRCQRAILSGLPILQLPFAMVMQ